MSAAEDGLHPELSGLPPELRYALYAEASAQMAAEHEVPREARMPSAPVRVDPPFCGCDDCFSGLSVPLSSANWQTIRAMLDETVEDATGTELTMVVLAEGRPEPWVVVYPTAQAGWPDRQTWQWRHDPEGGRDE